MLLLILFLCRGKENNATKTKEEITLLSAFKVDYKCVNFRVLRFYLSKYKKALLKSIVRKCLLRVF